MDDFDVKVPPGTQEMCVRAVFFWKGTSLGIDYRQQDG